MMDDSQPQTAETEPVGPFEVKQSHMSLVLSQLKSLIIEEKEFKARSSQDSTERSEILKRLQEDRQFTAQFDVKSDKMVEEMLEQKAASDSIILFKKGSSLVKQSRFLRNS